MNPNSDTFYLQECCPNTVNIDSAVRTTCRVTAIDSTVRTVPRACTNNPGCQWSDPRIMLARFDLRLSVELDWPSELSGKCPAGDWH